MATPDMDVIKEIPGYKVIVKAILKNQIQQLVEQLACTTDEECVILTASLTDGTLSHLGSEFGIGFIEDHQDIKSQFLSFCLKKHYIDKQQEKRQQKAKTSEASIHDSSEDRNIWSPRSGSLQTSSDRSKESMSVRFEPYPMTRSRRSALTSDEHSIKVESDDENEVSNLSESDKPSTPSDVTTEANMKVSVNDYVAQETSQSLVDSDTDSAFDETLPCLSVKLEAIVETLKTFAEHDSELEYEDAESMGTVSETKSGIGVRPMETVCQTESGIKGVEPLESVDEIELGITRVERLRANVKKVNNKNGRRQYNKLLACYYCEKTFRHRIKRHLECKHYNERMVAEALAKSSKVEMKKAIDRIKNLGNYTYNINVINKGSGSLIVSRRPNKGDLKAADYLPCVYCLGFCYKKELWRHARTCPWNKNKAKHQAGIVARSKLLLAGSLEPKEFSEGHMPQELSDTVFTNMRQDDVYRSLINDQLILQYGKVLINQLGPRHTHNVSQRMRQLARLKMHLNKTQNQDEGLHFYVNPSKFDDVVTAVKQLAGYSRNNAQISVYETPSLAITLGHNIGKVAEILRGIAIRNKDDIVKRDAEDFLQLLSSEWNHLVSSVALAVQEDDVESHEDTGSIGDEDKMDLDKELSAEALDTPSEICGKAVTHRPNTPRKKCRKEMKTPRYYAEDDCVDDSDGDQEYIPNDTSDEDVE